MAAGLTGLFLFDDGLSFIPSGTAGFTVPDARGADGSSVTTIALASTASGRYVKLGCGNNGLLPAWRNAPGGQWPRDARGNPGESL